MIYFPLIFIEMFPVAVHCFFHQVFQPRWYVWRISRNVQIVDAEPSKNQDFTYQRTAYLQFAYLPLDISVIPWKDVAYSARKTRFKSLT